MLNVIPGGAVVVSHWSNQLHIYFIFDLYLVYKPKITVKMPENSFSFFKSNWLHEVYQIHTLYIYFNNNHITDNRFQHRTMVLWIQSRRKPVSRYFGRKKLFYHCWNHWRNSCSLGYYCRNCQLSIEVEVYDCFIIVNERLHAVVMERFIIINASNTNAYTESGKLIITPNNLGTLSVTEAVMDPLANWTVAPLDLEK